MLLSFVAVTSFWFRGFLVFGAVRLDDGLKPLFFSPAAAVTSFVRRFSCIPLSKKVLFFSCGFGGHGGGLYFSVAVLV